jgi:alcohol dehydrogenase (cytochrome c)
VAGFGYSAAMANAGLTWDTATIDAFLTSTTQKVPGKSMSVEISAAADRSNVIAYLQTLGQAAAVSAPAPEAPGNAAPAEGPTQAKLLRAASDTHNWLYASKDYSGQRFVDLDQINASNATALRAVCIYRSNNAGATQSSLLVYKGVMYLTIDQAIVAIAARTSGLIWLI